MTRKSTKIVLMGKRTDEGENLQNLIKDLFPKSLPCDFIYSITFCYDDNFEFELPKSDIPETISLDDPLDLIKDVDYNYDGHLEIIEIILDLNNVKGFLSKGSDDILSKIFPEKS
jgi:hypothetical protein|tara:strand:+ start:581 stop:925 length:345 start_codon:yes stop_codon:yes gene_type:complete